MQNLRSLRGGRYVRAKKVEYVNKDLFIYIHVCEKECVVAVFNVVCPIQLLAGR